MAVEFVQEKDILRLSQTRAGFRISAVVIALFWLLGAAITAFSSLHDTPTTLACDHAEARCTLTEGLLITQVPISEIVAISLQTNPNAAFVRLERSDTPRLHGFCASTPDAVASAPAQAVVTALETFRADPSHPPIAVQCVAHPVDGAKLPVVLAASLGGWLLVLLLTFQFSTETHVVLGRRAGTITARGRSWFRPSWSVERPLTDVTRITRTCRYAGRDQRRYLVHAVFTDGTRALLWSPVAVRPTTLEQPVAALRGFLGLPKEDTESA